MSTEFVVPERSYMDDLMPPEQRDRQAHEQHPHRAKIDGLRALAQHIEEHGYLYFPNGTFHLYYSTKDELLEAIKGVGFLTKSSEPNGDYFGFVRDFGGGIKIDFYTNRQKICERVKVGEKLLPAEPERIVPEHVEPAKPERVVDVYEWQCPESILAPVPATEEETDAAL